MSCFVLQVVTFALGVLVFAIGKVPLTRRRMVRGSAARVIGAILMIPLLLYLVVCMQYRVPPLGSDSQQLDSHVHTRQGGGQPHLPPLGSDPQNLNPEPIIPVTPEGFVQASALAAALGCLLAATVLALVTSETRRGP